MKARTFRLLIAGIRGPGFQTMQGFRARKMGAMAIAGSMTQRENIKR